MLESNLELITIKNKRFFISFPRISGYTYALYIKFKNKIEKQFYQKNNQFVSEIELIPGVYTVTFFYKDRSGKRTHNKRMFKLTSDYEMKLIEESDLVEEDNYKITYFNVGSEKTFIVFNGGGSTKKSPVFALSFLLEQNYNVIACLQDNHNNYQDLSFKKFQSLLTPYLENKEVFLYGSSLGGYCAFYYAGAVNGCVIAAAPMNSLDPRVIERFPRESEYMDDDFLITKEIEEGRFKHLPLDSNPLTKKKCFVFVDPLIKRDVYYLEEIVSKAYPEAMVSPIEYAGHTVLYHLNKTGQLHSIIKNIVNNKEFTVDSSLNSEFVFYEKAKYYLSLARKMTKLSLESEPVNPLIKKRAEALKSRFNL